MGAGKKIYYVPWADSSEWNTVRDQMFSANINDTVRAFETILMWKLKYSNIPAYIECTYSLLQVMVKEYQMMGSENSSSCFNENDLQLSYSTALIRFVNHVSSVSSYKGHTLFLAAKTQNIPIWIISMRHDAAHGQDLPSLDALHVAAELSLNWLLDNYWVNSNNFVEKSLELSQLDEDFSMEGDVNAQIFFKKAFYVWELCSNLKYRKLDLDEEFIIHLEEILNLANIYFKDSRIYATEYLQSIVDEHNQMKEGVISTNSINTIKYFKVNFIRFLKSIAKSNAYAKDSLVISLLETTFLSEKNFEPFNWKSILHLVQGIGSFSFLFQILFQMAGNGYTGASKWLTVLSPSIQLLKKQWSILRVLKKETKNYKAKLLKQKVKNFYRPKNCDTILKLDIFKPPIISLEMLSGILLNPENFSVKVIVEYLRMVKPPLLESTINLIKDLVTLYVQSENEKEVEDVDDEKIFTLEDLEEGEKPLNLVFEEAKDEESGWVKSSIDASIWSKCPLGILPFQSKIDCSLPKELTWKRRPPLRKRISREFEELPLVKHSINMKRIREN